MSTTTTDTGYEASCRMEDLTAAEQERLTAARHYDEQGWTYLAKRARRQAAGHKGARNRIARRMGWMS